MAESCITPNCTVGVTGECLLEDDPKTCPHRAATDIPSGIDLGPIEDTLPTRTTIHTFPPSITMSLQDVSLLMESQACKIVGIVGSPNAGKTAALVCLYLLLAAGKFPDFELVESNTIMGLEQISRGARRWKPGDAPGKLTIHTELPDERAAGFLHLRLHQHSTNQVTNIVFPDLPGEWSTSLIDENNKERLNFLRSAEAIWVMTDGEQLATNTTRQKTLHRLSVLLQRVVALTKPDCPPFFLVITRRDKGAIPAAAYNSFLAEAERQGISLNVVQIASFSEDENIEPGAGLEDLIKTLFPEIAPPELWPLDQDPEEARQALRYRSRKDA